MNERKEPLVRHRDALLDLKGLYGTNFTGHKVVEATFQRIALNVPCDSRRLAS